MLIETRLRRAIAEIRGLETEFPSAWGQKERGHFEIARLHLQCIHDTFKSERKAIANPPARVAGDPGF